MNSNTNTEKGQSKLIFDESPLTFSPTVAHAIGLNSAIILQQIYYLSRQPKSGKILDDGKKYIWNSYDGWKRYFSFWSEKTIKRHFRTLEKARLLISKQPNKSNWDNTKYYRINDEKLAELIDLITGNDLTRSMGSDCPHQETQLDPIDGDNLTRSSAQRIHTENTAKKTPNISFASDDAEKIIEGEIVLPESSLMTLSGEVPAVEKTLHQELMLLIESATGKLTASEAAKEGKGAKLIREYIEKNPDTTIQDVAECLKWIRENKRWMQLSLTSVASELRTYMTNKRFSKDGKVRGTQFLSSQEKSMERLMNRDYEKLILEGSNFYKEYAEQFGGTKRRRP